MTSDKSIIEDLGTNKKHLTVMLLITVVFLALRLWAISARSLWFDEAFEFWTSNNALKDIVTANLSSFQPPLYSLILHFWLKLGDSPAWMRLLSLFFGIIGLVGLVSLSYDLFGFNAAWLSAAVLAVLPSDIRYTQEAAEYQLLFGAIVWLVYFQIKADESNKWKCWILLLLAWIIGIYSHYGAAICIFSSGLWLLIRACRTKNKAMILKLSLISILFLVMISPLVPMLISQKARQSLSGNVIGGFVAELKLLYQSVFQTFSFPISGWPFTKVLRSIVEVTVYATVVAVLWHGFKGSAQYRRLLSVLLITSCVYYMLVRMGVYAYGSFGFRYMMILVPIAIITLSALLSELFTKGKFARLFALLLSLSIVSLCIYSLPNRPMSQLTRGNTLWPETQDMEDLVSYLEKKRAKATDIYVYYGAAPAFAYYQQHSQLKTETPFPANWITDCWGKQSLAVCSSNSVYYGKWIRNLSSEEKVSSIETQFDNKLPNQLWLIFSHVGNNEDHQIVYGLITDEGYTISEVKNWIGASLYLLDRP